MTTSTDMRRFVSNQEVFGVTACVRLVTARVLM